MTTELPKIAGAIFDMDDTILDNQSNGPFGGLHEKSRLLALHAYADTSGLPQLLGVGQIENYNAFHSSTSHSLEGAIWKILKDYGIVDDNEVDRTNPHLTAIMHLKDELHGPTLLSEGKPIENSVRFIRGLEAQGLGEKLAIASSATIRDIHLFLGMTGLSSLFPESRIQARETTTHFKPHPEPFDKAFISLNLPESKRSSVLAFEDDIRGVESAIKAGLFVCALTSRYSRSDFENSKLPPHVIADSYEEFADILDITLID